MNHLRYRDQAESSLSTLQPESPEQKEVQGMIAVLHGEQHILLGEGDRALECAERALRLLPAEALHIRSYAIAEQVLAYQMAGDIGAGLKIINEILNAPALLPGISSQNDALVLYCILDGRRPEWLETTGITVPETWSATRAAGID